MGKKQSALLISEIIGDQSGYLHALLKYIFADDSMLELMEGFPAMNSAQNALYYDKNSFGYSPSNVHFDAYREEIENGKITFVFVYKDPRDILVSLLRMLPVKKEYLNTEEIEDDSKILISLMTESPHTSKPSFQNILDDIRSLYNIPNCYAVAVEELLTSPVRVLKNILTYFNYPVDMNKILDATKHVPYTYPTGLWRQYFNANVERRFKGLTKDLLMQLGYEKSSAWSYLQLPKTKTDIDGFSAGVRIDYHRWMFRFFFGREPIDSEIIMATNLTKDMDLPALRQWYMVESGFIMHKNNVWKEHGRR